MNHHAEGQATLTPWRRPGPQRMPTAPPSPAIANSTARSTGCET